MDGSQALVDQGVSKTLVTANGLTAAMLVPAGRSVGQWEGGWVKGGRVGQWEGGRVKGGLVGWLFS